MTTLPSPFDAQRRVTSWNTDAETITGYAAQEIIGQSGDLLFIPEDRERGMPAKEAQHAHENGHFYNERWHLHKDGSRFLGSGVVMPLRESSTPPGCLKILRDMTSIYQTEQAHRQAEDRFALVVQSIEEYAIYMLDLEGRVTTWNPGAERIKGYSQKEIIGQHFSVYFPPEAIAAGQPAKELEIAAREGRFHGEAWRVRKGGARYWGDELLAALRGEDNQLLGYIRFCCDLTERKRQEDERARLLEAEQSARHAAEAANETKDRFRAALSHELRTPLTPVQMALHLIGREKGLPQSVHESISMIRINVAVEVRLIGDLLDVSRITYGKLELNMEPVDLHECIHRALEVCHEDFRAKNHQLSVELTTSQHRVQGVARPALTTRHAELSAKKCQEYGHQWPFSRREGKE